MSGKLQGRCRSERPVCRELIGEVRQGGEGFSHKSYILRKLLVPVFDLLRQGVAPGKIAISISLGLALGVFPVVGTTTLLCTLAAVTLGLNLPAIQLVNFLASPLQLALLIPFMQIGARLFGSDPLALSLPQVMLLVRSDLRLAVVTLWSTTIHGIGAWLCIAGPLVAGLYLILARLLRNLAHSFSLRRLTAGGTPR